MWQLDEKKKYPRFDIILTDYECSILGETLEDVLTWMNQGRIKFPLSDKEKEILVTLKEAFRNLGNHKVMEVIETGIDAKFVKSDKIEGM